VAEAKMEFAQSARLTVMGELTASIAHEIKQPLAAIVTNGNYCLRQLATTTPNLREVRQAIQDIVEDGNRTSSIISRIRALLLKGAPERGGLDMNQVIRDVAYFVRAEVEENGITLKLDLAADLPRALGDQVQLQQALMNVIINSIEALRTAPQPHRELLIRSRKIPEGVLIEVKDSGPELVSAVSERLFEPFFTTKTEGMGLGLSISRSIIESHGGSLSNIEATYGAHFAFIIPESPKSSQD
jgi:C4-dicarboxylate-specific signal transduction histidine kinase